jgi:acyl-CoA synthetase (NDP forming)
MSSQTATPSPGRGWLHSPGLNDRSGKKELGALASMLEARSVAVVGASNREDSPGLQMVHQLVTGGFGGQIYPVNPKYREVNGLRCYPSVAEVPGEPDVAMLGVPNAAIEGSLREAAEAGVRSAVIFASAWEAPGQGPSLQERLGAIAREADMDICGPNCMGFVNVERNLRALAFAEREDLEPGSVTWLSHSGSAFSALLHARRGFGFNMAVSTGQEVTTTMADYLRYALTLSSTRVAALFLETVRDPEAFREVLEEASARDVAVVALKVGRESAAREMVAAHSGALAGEDAAYEAVFEAHGVLRVGTLDELADTLELLAAGRRAAPGGLAAIHDSGGERAHFIDVASETGVRFAEVSDHTRERLDERLDPGLPATNPLDAWGTGRDYEGIFADCMRALLEDEDTAGLAFVVDLSGEDLEGGYVDVAREVFPGTEKPTAVLCNLAGAVAPGAAGDLRESGIPVLEGTASGLLAFRHLFELRDSRSLPHLLRPEAVSEEVRNRWLERLRSDDPWSEVEALRMLSDYGIPTAAAEEARAVEDVVAAAGRVGWPVALKTAEARHKSDVGGVLLGLDDEEAVRSAYSDLAARLGPRVTVAGMAPPGVELALGTVLDPQFGPMLLVAAGGVLVEVLRDRRMAVPPLDEPRARRLVDGLQVRPILEGVRGGLPADLGSVARAIVSLSVLALDLGDQIEAIDVNPLLCGPGGCVAVDALVVPR